MTTCCFVFIPGILENQDSEFLAWVLVSIRYHVGWAGRWKTGEDTRKWLGYKSGPHLRWEGTLWPALSHSSFWSFPAQHSPLPLRPKEPWCPRCLRGGPSNRKKSDTNAHPRRRLKCYFQLANGKDLIAFVCSAYLQLIWTFSILIFSLPNFFMDFSVLICILDTFIIYLKYCEDQVIYMWKFRGRFLDSYWMEVWKPGKGWQWINKR